MVVTNNPRIFRTIKTLRVHGQDGRWNFTRVGYNSRLDAIQAAVLRVKLKTLDWTLKRRHEIAARYTEELWDVVQTPPGHIKHSWAVYTIESEKRDRIQAALKDKGIESAVHYPISLPDLPVYADGGDYPKARKAAGRVLSLPIYPQMTNEEQSIVIEAICNV
jgi:dTDP-4-amino-4,6-dideoxygalactose transaminase